MTVAGLMLAMGCGAQEEPQAEAVPVTQPLTCSDRDGDGYGQGCDAGSDCDDDDPTENVECAADCSQPAEGCPCEPGTHPVDCIPDLEHDEVFCNEGTRYCRDGQWTTCMPIFQF